MIKLFTATAVAVLLAGPALAQFEGGGWDEWELPFAKQESREKKGEDLIEPNLSANALANQIPSLLTPNQYTWVVIGRGLAQCMLEYKVFPDEEVSTFFLKFIKENAGVSSSDYLQLSRSMNEALFRDVSAEIDRQGGCPEIIRSVNNINKAMDAPKPELKPRPSTPFEW